MEQKLGKLPAVITSLFSMGAMVQDCKWEIVRAIHISLSNLAQSADGVSIQAVI